MDTTDVYTKRRLMYEKCDNSISKIYTHLFKILSSTERGEVDQPTRNEVIKEIDSVVFQIFKYKTALLTLQKDIAINQESQVYANQQIEKSKDEIRTLMEQIKNAQLIRKRKLQFNQIAKSVKQLNTSAELTVKITEIENEVQKIQNQYQAQMEVYAEKERCLRIALSALKVFLKDDVSQYQQLTKI